MYPGEHGIGPSCQRAPPSGSALSRYAEAVDRLEIGGHVLELVVGDITTIPADAIVNAANSSLLGGGGVDGAIHRAGGPEIMADLERRYGRERHCPTGGAVVTTAGRLQATWVIHTVGPRWRGGHNGEPQQLASAYRAALRLAAEVGAVTVTLPGISLGIYGYPVEAGAAIAVETVAALLQEETVIRRATFVVRPDTVDAFRSSLREVSHGRPLADERGRVRPA
jgi:O-acetyl-ADP-ribose deacetylase (regulator of RNase III)